MVLQTGVTGQLITNLTSSLTNPKLIIDTQLNLWWES